MWEVDQKAARDRCKIKLRWNSFLREIETLSLFDYLYTLLTPFTQRTLSKLLLSLVFEHNSTKGLHELRVKLWVKRAKLLFFCKINGKPTKQWRFFPKETLPSSNNGSIWRWEKMLVVYVNRTVEKKKEKNRPNREFKNFLLISLKQSWHLYRIYFRLWIK